MLNNVLNFIMKQIFKCDPDVFYVRFKFLEISDMNGAVSRREITSDEKKCDVRLSR